MSSVPAQNHQPWRATARRPDSMWLLASALLSGAGAYGFHLIASRALDPSAFAPVGVLWTIQFLIVSIALLGIEAFVIRRTLTTNRPGGGRPAVALWVGGTTLAVAVLTYGLRGVLFPGAEPMWAAAPAATLSYGAFSLVRGRAAAGGRYGTYGSITALDGLGRLAGAVIAAGTSTPLAFAWAMPLAPAAAIAFGLARLGRGPAHEHEHGHEVHPPLQPPSPVPAQGFLGVTAVANGLGQALLAGGPLVALWLGANQPEVATLVITLTMARAPLVIAFNGALARILGPLTRAAGRAAGRNPASLRRMALRIAGSTALAATVTGFAGAALGPALLAVVFGEELRPPIFLAAAAAAGAILATGGFVLMHLLIAWGLERRVPLGWGAGLVAAVLALAWVDAAPTGKVAAGFLAGEAIALCALAAAALTARQREGVHRR